MACPGTLRRAATAGTSAPVTACAIQTDTFLLKNRPRGSTIIAGAATAMADIRCPAAMAPTSISEMDNAIQTERYPRSFSRAEGTTAVTTTIAVPDADIIAIIEPASVNRRAEETSGWAAFHHLLEVPQE